MKRVLTGINRALRPGDGEGFRRVHSEREFASILNRERDRSDRTGQEFSLVVFESTAGDRKSPPAKKLVSILQRRIRSTDDIGWLEDGRLAAVFPHTPPDGALKFVDTVRRAFDESTPLPECVVYAYPSGRIAITDGDPAHTPPNDRTNPLQHPIPFPGAKYSGSEGANPGRPLEELESDFLCPVPAWKRAIDIVGSLVAMILLSPLALLVAMFIKIASPGPIFFRQERVGYLGRRFTLWKFRTMDVNTDSTVHQKHLRELMTSGKEMAKLDTGEDYRIIPFGYMLRATGIDELPQLLNVLRGEMSLVGPRPCLAYEVREYASWHMRRFDTVPGLTGLWQVSGKNRTTFMEMMRLDIGYVRRRALLLDLKIFLKTIPAIVRQVAARPSFAAIRAKGFSVAHRIGTIILALSLVGTHRK